jgi:hypothetical protein
MAASRNKLEDRLTKQTGSRNMARGLLKKRGQENAKGKLTSKGKKRQKLGAAGRAKDRAAKASGGKSSDYKYNSRTNRAIKK